ncbi:MAG: cation/H(+) antiporter, partial [Bacteroidales bacterium]|nr:cation/H(+) antiporter [Bacteroidales bacterium]
SFGRPESGPALLAVVRAIFGNSNEEIEVTALHMTVGSDVNPILVERYSQEGFNPILEEAKQLQIPIRTEYRITDNAGQEIVDITNTNRYDFLLVGAGLSIMKQDLFKRNWQIKPHFSWLVGLLQKIGNSFFLYPGNLLNDKTRVFIEQTKSSVGIFIDHGFKSISNMLVLLYLPDDVHLLQCAQTVLENNPEARSVILDVNGLITKNPAVIKNIRHFSDRFENRVTLLHKKRITADILNKQDFMLISYASWDAVSSEYKNAMEKIPSTLIIREKQL